MYIAADSVRYSRVKWSQKLGTLSQALSTRPSVLYGGDFFMGFLDKKKTE